MLADGAAVPSVASVLVVFFAFGAATIALLWLMDMLVDALRWRVIGRREAHLRGRQSTAAEDAREGAQRPWWRRLLEG